MVSLRALLEEMVKLKASDLHLTAGVPAQLRVDGELTPSKLSGVLTPDVTQRLAYSALSDEQKKKFENTNELDFSFGVKGLARFRGNCFVQRGVVTAVVRMIPFEVAPFETLGLPKSVSKFADLTRGLVLLTGPTGSGKSTTLASLIDRINTERPEHIVTIEDPIEFMHGHKRAIVNQREVGADTHTFNDALKHVLRQDPDLILLGEMRDRETMATALTIAETGHLCFATLHTNSAVESITRIVDTFPADQHNQIYSQLAFVLRGVVTQSLLPKMAGNGRALARRGHGLHAGHQRARARGQGAPDLQSHPGRADARHADDEPVAGEPLQPERDLVRGRRAAQPGCQRVRRYGRPLDGCRLIGGSAET